MKVQQQGEKQSCTLTLKRGDGTLFPARMDGIRISGRDGEITIRIAISDITDIWQIAALRDSEEKYRVIFNNEFYAICIFDLDTLKLLNVNDAYTKMYGYTRKELLSGMTIHDISAEHNATDSATEKAKDEGTIFIPLRYHRKKDGTIFPVEIVGGPYEWKGKQVMFALSHDITERKRVEDALALASRKLTLLSSITRHDINNQLTALLGYISLLEKKQSALAFKEYFPKIDGVVKRISTIFQFTREYEKIGIHAPLWQNCRILVNTAGKEVPLGQIILKNDLPASAEIFADPLIARVFYNLMDNAVLYGGKITTIRFSACDHERERIIVCENDGVSVPAEEKEKIFERGFGKNTGMGLFLSREILSITGITIRESGEAGKGVRFEMTVPKGAWRMTGEGD
jgi:PAS domain S-box-containing protein